MPPRKPSKTGGGIGTNQYGVQPGGVDGDDASQEATADVADGAQQFAKGTPHPQMEALQVAMEADVPVILWGEPGTGKTAQINALAESQGMPMETVIASLREPADFAGLPVVGQDEQGRARVDLAPPRWAERLSEDEMGSERAVLFLDEISTATPAVQAALLRVSLDRVVGDTKLGSGVRVVAAANEVEHAAGGWDLAPATANRFCHLNWTTDTDETTNAFITGQWPDPQPLTVPSDWRDRVPSVRTKVGTFLKARPGLIQAPPAEESEAGRGWPSKRSWTHAVSLLACAEASGASDNAKARLLSGTVGEGPASEYLSWERNMDLPDPASILRDPRAVKIAGENGDRVYAMVYGVAGAVANNPTKETWEQAMDFFIHVGDQGQRDSGGVGIRMIMGHRPPDAKLSPELKDYVPMLKAGGFIPK